MAVAEARFYFTIGLPFEKAWLPRLAGAAPNLKVVDMTAGIKRLSSGEDAERAAELGLRSHGEVHDGHEHGEDPHVWLSPMLVRAMIPNVVKALAAERPGDAARFRAAAKTLDDELQALDAELADIFAPFPKEKRIFLTNYTEYLVRVGDQLLQVQTPHRNAFAQGETCYLKFPGIMWYGREDEQAEAERNRRQLV